MQRKIWKLGPDVQGHIALFMMKYFGPDAALNYRSFLWIEIIFKGEINVTSYKSNEFIRF